MPVFVVVVRTGIEHAAQQIAALPEQASYQLTDDAWLVDYDGTSRACAEKLKIRGTGSTSTGIVFPISNYSGRFPADAWEWLGLHMGHKGE
jgi:hypothetical protein